MIDMSDISVTAENEIKVYLAKWWTAINQQLSQATGNTVQISQEAPLDMLFASEIGQCLRRIAEAAEGLISWSPDAAQSILAECGVFEAWSNQSPIVHHTPEEFWNTSIGFMVLKARLWAELDRLTSLKEASELSGLSLSSISQRVSRGQMKYYRDPLEANPQRARRIRLTDLEHFIHDGIVRKPNATVISRLSMPISAIKDTQYQYREEQRKGEKTRA
jgi:hypothetical protein